MKSVETKKAIVKINSFSGTFSVNKITDATNGNFKPLAKPNLTSMSVNIVAVMMTFSQKKGSSMGMITSKVKEVVEVGEGKYLVRTKNSTYSVNEE